MDIQHKIYYSSKFTSQTYIKFFQHQLLYSFELRIFAFKIFLTINSRTPGLTKKVLASFNFLLQNILFCVSHSIKINYEIQSISFFLSFFILEPEWEAVFYTYSYPGRFSNLNFKPKFENLNKFFYKLKKFIVCSVNVRDTFYTHQYKGFLSCVKYSYSLEKKIFYFLYEVNGGLYFFSKNESIFWFKTPLHKYFRASLSILFLNILLSHFDFFSSLFCIDSLNGLISLHFRVSYNFLFFAKNSFCLKLYISMVQRILFFNFKIFSFKPLFISDFFLGFTFIGFNFSNYYYLDHFKITPSSYSVLYFLTVFKILAYSSITLSA